MKLPSNDPDVVLMRTGGEVRCFRVYGVGFRARYEPESKLLAAFPLITHNTPLYNPYITLLSGIETVAYKGSRALGLRSKFLNTYGILGEYLRNSLAIPSMSQIHKALLGECPAQAIS